MSARNSHIKGSIQFAYEIFPELYEACRMIVPKQFWKTHRCYFCRCGIFKSTR